MRKIKVLWVITVGLRRNGICISQLEYAKRIDKSMFELDVAAVHDDSEEMIEEYEKAGCEVIVLPDRRKNVFKYVNNLRKIINEKKYDIIHVMGSSSLLCIELMTAKQCGVKVRIAHSRNTTCDRRGLEKLIRPFFKHSYNYALACGKEAGEWLFGKGEFTTFYNGKDLQKYGFSNLNREKIRKEYKIGDRIAVGHVGNFNEQKNHSLLIDIFFSIYKENKNVVLFLMGEGDKKTEIEDKVKRLGIDDNVIFMGSIENVNEILSAMDVMIFPSLFEGLPNVVLEWQASGVPSLISDVITEECSVSDSVNFVKLNDLEQWKTQFFKTKILDSLEREKKSMENCRKLEERGFEIITNTQQLEKMYEQYVEENKI